MGSAQRIPDGKLAGCWEAHWRDSGGRSREARYDDDHRPFRTAPAATRYADEREAERHAAVVRESVACAFVAGIVRGLPSHPTRGQVAEAFAVLLCDGPDRRAAFLAACAAEVVPC
jgi:hypothetical protein